MTRRSRRGAMPLRPGSRAVWLAMVGAITLCAAQQATRAAAADVATLVDSSTSLEAALTGGLDLVRERGQLVWQELTSITDDWRLVQAAWSGAWASADTLRAVTYGLVLLMIGAGTEWLYWCYAGRARRAIAESAMAGAPAVKLPAKATAALAGRRMLLEAFGLFLFAFAMIGASSAFVWPAGVHEAIVALTLGVTGARAATITARFVLSPRPARLRLIVLDDAAARRLYRLTIGLAAVLATTYVAGAMFAPSGSLLGLAVVGRACAGTAIAGLALAMVHPRRPPAGRGRENRFGASGSTVRQFLATALIVGGLVLYLLDLRQMVWSIAVVLLAGVADRALRAVIDRFTAEPPAPDLVGGGVTTAAAYRSVLHRAFDISIFSAAVVGLAAIWGAPVLELARSGTVAGRLVDVAIVLLAADLVWVWAKTAIDRRLAAIVPAESSETADPSARLATLLPLLRKGLLILVSTLVVLISLSALGVDIAPLLAGAGVVGIAIGFGAQTLVRDIVSGVFYLLEDSFRIGEYVEFGNIRGTVEGISLRFLKLRHHRGAIHTIPFGEVRWLTNHSRDWVVVNLDFRVPFDTNVELARRLIKRIGAELAEDPEIGPCIIEPVKSRGVVRLEEYCMVIGVKFMARPGDGQFAVRREAYHRIRDAFAANGIRFHDRSVKVQVVGEPTDESRPREALEQPASTAALGAAAGDAVGALGPAAKPTDC